MNALLEAERTQTWKSSGEGRNERTREQPFVDRLNLLIENMGSGGRLLEKSWLPHLLACCKMLGKLPLYASVSSSRIMRIEVVPILSGS